MLTIAVALILGASSFVATFERPMHAVNNDIVTCYYFRSFAVKVRASAPPNTSVVRYGKPAVVKPCANAADEGEKMLRGAPPRFLGVFDDFIVLDGTAEVGTPFAIYDTKSGRRVLSDIRLGSLNVDKAKISYRRIEPPPEGSTCATFVSYNVIANRGDFDAHAISSATTCLPASP